jgi:hypothetical protein
MLLSATTADVMADWQSVTAPASAPDPVDPPEVLPPEGVSDAEVPVAGADESVLGADSVVAVEPSVAGSDDDGPVAAEVAVDDESSEVVVADEAVVPASITNAASATLRNGAPAAGLSVWVPWLSEPSVLSVVAVVESVVPEALSVTVVGTVT